MMNIGSKKNSPAGPRAEKSVKVSLKITNFVHGKFSRKMVFLKKFFFHLKERIKLKNKNEFFSKIFIHSRVIDKVLFLEHH